MEKKDFKRLCELSQLELSEKQEEKLLEQMSGILTMVEQLPDISDVSNPLDGIKEMALREDVVAPSLTRDELLNVVPKTQAGCILLPSLKN